LKRDTRIFESGVLAAFLAVTLQLALLFGAVTTGPNPSADAITQAHHCGAAPGQSTHHEPACLLCPICLAATIPGLLPVSPDAPAPAVRLVVSTRGKPAASQVPQARVSAAPFPRGPPLI
jgi:hypothetical protein